jgi:isocitrate lyase
VADAEAGFGGAADAYEFMRSMIGAGAAGVGFEDQLSPDAGPGQRGGKVLIPTGQHIETLTAARLAADVLDVPALVIARTGAHLASLLTAATDDRDHEFLTGELSPEGYYRVQPGLYACVTRGLAFAPYADLLWMEAPEPDLAEARAFAGVIHSQYPGKMLAYSCSPSSSGQGHPDDAAAAEFRAELTAMGYRFQFTAAAGFRALDAQASELAGRNTPAYAER